ncbi:hypothetical protein BOX15_Mlig025022g3 [Macrostomum lignano]|uniref:Kinesin-like protein n=1 Tax=Macrostomum lignano TaxID=282301 RepID=A0A267DZX0_9PLAT|nr:hypothetical protein BOX15_Mlig025022g3 [Macrostomum lignano]
MDGTQTVITDPASGQDKKFAFDYSYWSHDGFTEQANGYFAPASAKYADQQKVFDDLGRGVLDNAWEGYNCSLFAYGQTGSGKSYSMIGYQANKGIVPIACEDLFKAIEAKKPEMKAGEEYQVSLSMIEIYNEQVRDLLVSKTVKGGLKIRQHPNKGFYVEQLTTSPVSSYAQIEAKIAEGSHNRTVAATNMNATSSRAHTIVAISFTQKTLDGSGQSMTRSSVMNLVDLAGSERADSTGATGDRLKEGSAINQSLSTLGNCIKALADQSTGNSKVVVPFRDSVLTKLLQNALGGNSKTVMIAALSPADINFEETLSTLRFADRAKAIKTKAVVNESPTDKLIRELREENQRLMEMLKSGGGEAVSSSGSGGGDGEGSEEAEERMRELMKRNQEEMEAMERQWAEKLAQAQAESQAQIRDKEAVGERRKQQPHLWNLNEDPSLSGLIVHFCEPGSHTIGREAEFQLRGISILPQHATLNNSSDKVTLTPQNGAKVCVNGREVVQETLLNHHDRVLFGNNHLYVFDNPKAAAPSPSPIPTFEAAQAELAENSGVMGLLGDKAKSSSAEDMLLMDDLVKLYPQVQEANAMSEELDRRVRFELVLMSPQGRGLRENEGRTEVYISLTNLDSGNEFFWSKDKFSDRKYLMRDMYQNYMEGESWKLPQEKDPFWEPADSPLLIGTCHVYLQSLAYLIEVAESFSVTDFRGEDQGKLEIELRPCDSEWRELGEEFSEPDDVIGQAINFKVKLNKGHDLSPKYAAYYCQYKFYLEDEFTRTPEASKAVNPQFKFEKKYTFKPVTKQLMDYLQNSYIIVELWGRQKDSGKKSSKTTKELMQGDKPKQGAVGDSRPAPAGAAAASAEAKNLKSELDTLKQKSERNEQKIKQLQTLVNEARKSGKDVLQVDKVDKILSATAASSARPVVNKGGKGGAAAAGGGGKSGSSATKAEEKRSEAMGKSTSAACSIQ